MLREDDAYISDFPEDFPKDAAKEKKLEGMIARDIIDKRLMHLHGGPSKQSQERDHRDHEMSLIEEHNPLQISTQSIKPITLNFSRT